MLNKYNKCETVMSSDSSTCLGYCPKPKKSKPSSEEKQDSTVRTISSNWAHLPSIVVHEIFDLLNKSDRLNASAVCKNWRQNVFHPKWWPTITFHIEPGHIERSKFFTNTFGKIATNVTIKVNTLVCECTDEFISLLEVLSENNNLKELIIEPTHCYFNMSCHSRYDVPYVVGALKKLCLGNLVKFSYGCIEDFSHVVDDYLSVLSKKQPEKITHLGLATVKDIPNNYESSYFDSNLLRSFVNLKILSVDYEQVSDKFLTSLETLSAMERLVVHLHNISAGHPGTTNYAWKEFKEQHPNCELRLTVIHAYKEINKLETIVLRNQMPLSHLKVFFCENINLNILEYLAKYYRKTLRSFMWVDSLNPTKRTWSLVTKMYADTPDPLIMMSWLCEKLEELVFYGYKYSKDNLIAIARLRQDKLKVFEFAEEDVLSPYGDRDPPYIRDITAQLKRSWAPRKLTDLHPVICNPVAGDSDEYLLPIVLADLH